MSNMRFKNMSTSTLVFGRFFFTDPDRIWILTDPDSVENSDPGKNQIRNTEFFNTLTAIYGGQQS